MKGTPSSLADHTLKQEHSKCNMYPGLDAGNSRRTTVGKNGEIQLASGAEGTAMYQC